MFTCDLKFLHLLLGLYYFGYFQKRLTYLQKPVGFWLTVIQLSDIFLIKQVD